MCCSNVAHGIVHIQFRNNEYECSINVKRHHSSIWAQQLYNSNYSDFMLYRIATDTDIPYPTKNIKE